MPLNTPPTEDDLKEFHDRRTSGITLSKSQKRLRSMAFVYSIAIAAFLDIHGKIDISDIIQSTVNSAQYSVPLD